MRIAVIIAVIVLVVPLATLAYLKINNGKVVIVRNTGNESIDYSVVISSGGAIEKTAPRTVAAHGLSWIIFYPRTKGLPVLRCTSGANIARVSLGLAGQSGASFSKLTLEGCSRVVTRGGFGF